MVPFIAIAAAMAQRPACASCAGHCDLHGPENAGLAAVPVTTTQGGNGSAVQPGDRTLASRLPVTRLESFDRSDGKIPDRWTIESAENQIAGTQMRGKGVRGTISGERAPALKRKAPEKGSGPASLFRGDGLIWCLDGFLARETAIVPAPGTWESFDVKLAVRTGTVPRNGAATMSGGALDARESQPGPIYLRAGDNNGVKYRNATVSVPAR